MRNTWNLAFGGASKEELLFRLAEQKINLNAYAAMLFASDNFTVSATSQHATIVELSLEALDLPDGAVFEEIVSAARLAGYALCPLELAPHLRLHYTAQLEGSKCTIASERAMASEEYPRGFYLSRSAESLWLRGYRASDDWRWPPESKFAFVSK